MATSSLLAAVVLAACGVALPVDSEELGSPLRVAQCRAQCLERFANGADMEAMCLQGPDCFMCWENCELLQSNYPVWGAMCSEKGICFPGCQQACRFHHETSTQPVQQAQPVIHTRGEEVVRTSGNVARWPRPPTTSPSAPLVYVVMRRLSGESSSWQQLTQTVELSARLPEEDADPNPSMIRVLVVDPEGLVTIYSPVSATSPVADAAPGQFLAGQTISKVMAGRRKKINTEVTPSTVSSMLQADGEAVSWKLREVSLIHQKVLVIAEIAWKARVIRGVYLVTWEVDGGGLKGNLFTDSTCVTLSLWPDTIYHIQVELVSRSADHRPERSEPMVIDTHRAPRGSVATDMRRPTSPLLAVLAAPGESREHLLAATAAAAGLLLVVLTAVLAWRRRASAAAAAGRCRVRPARLSHHSFFAGLQPVISVKDSFGKAHGLGSLFSAKGLGFGIRADGDPAAATNPLLGTSAPPTPEANHLPVAFLKAAERGARNEVQV